MSLAKLKEPFPEEDIEWRVAQAGESGGKIWASVLAYVSARAIQDRLDEVCGPENWEVKYEFIPGKDGLTGGIICKLSIRCGPGGTWVTKEDGAEQTDIESFKGGISSALKRAGSAWMIGRYIYGLDGGYADIVDKKTKGSRYGQTKDKKQFYWVPPRLPAWALPKTPIKQPEPAAKPPAAEPKTEPKTDPRKPVTEAQLKRLFAIMTTRGWKKEEVEELSIQSFGIKESLKELSMGQYDSLVRAVEKHTFKDALQIVMQHRASPEPTPFDQEAHI